MQKNKYVRLFTTIFVSGAAFIINCLINVILTPYITNSVGVEAYGFVSLANRVLQPLMKPVYGLPGAAALGIVTTFLSDNPAILALAEDT